MKLRSGKRLFLRSFFSKFDAMIGQPDQVWPSDPVRFETEKHLTKNFENRVVLDKYAAGKIVNAARIRSDKSWADLAAEIDKPLVWTTAALLGSHPVPPEDAVQIAKLIGLDDDVIESLTSTPFRCSGPDVSADPTIYRFHEALSVYGPALKELINEEFGDGIMSAINFSLEVSRRADPDGDRVVVTMDGKFLDYRW